MTFEEQASRLKHDEIVSLLIERDHLQQQVDWFKRQLFGSKSERRVTEANGRQLALGELPPAEEGRSEETSIAAHKRRRRHSRLDAAPDEGEIRFGADVPIERIDLPPGVPASELGDYEIVSEKITRRLAQRPGVYVVLEYRRPVLKRKGFDESITCAAAPPAVLEKSLADVSLLAGLLVDKFVYHLPLYRQHQRLAACGVRISRATLTNWVHRSAGLLEPVYNALLGSILRSRVVTMDETPLRVGPKKNKPPGRRGMKTAYFWPVYGERHEVAFPFGATRSLIEVRKVLGDYAGVLLSDGYEVYESYVARTNEIVHAQCWSHTRRGFEKALGVETHLADQALDRIARLYEQEKCIRALNLSPDRVLAYRAEHCKPIVEEFFDWLRTTANNQVLLPTNLFTKAAKYAQEREAALKVFLAYPDVPVDTNHLERAIRPIAIGRNYAHSDAMRSSCGRPPAGRVDEAVAEGRLTRCSA